MLLIFKLIIFALYFKEKKTQIRPSSPPPPKKKKPTQKTRTKTKQTEVEEHIN